jgi:hypothetical protein
MTKILVEHEINCSGNLCGHCQQCVLKLIDIKSSTYVHSCNYFGKQLSREGEEIDIRMSEFKNYQRLSKCIDAEIKGEYE